MAEHHEVFDAEPAHALSEGEPQTPMWMPAVGAALFLVVGLWAASGEDPSPAPNSPMATPSSTAAAPGPASAAVSAPGRGQPLRPVASGRRLRPSKVDRDAIPIPNAVRRAPIKAKPKGK